MILFSHGFKIQEKRRSSERKAGNTEADYPHPLGFLFTKKNLYYFNGKVEVERESPSKAGVKKESFLEICWLITKGLYSKIKWT